MPHPRNGSHVIPLILGVFGVLASLGASGSCQAEPTASIAQPVEIVLPDYVADLRAFRSEPPEWNRTLLNAGFGAFGKRADQVRRDGWWRKPENWLLMDYVDRGRRLTTQEFLEHRGIFGEVYGHNEYQETIHMHEDGVLALLGENGIARDLSGERVLDPSHNLANPRWAKGNKENAYIADNNAPRWSAILNYDLLTSPLLGDAVSQDNIGGPTSRIGAGAQGRYDDFNERKFRHYLDESGESASIRAALGPLGIRDYANRNLASLFEKIPDGRRKAPARNVTQNAAEQISADPVMAAYLRFQYISQLHNFQRYYRDNKLVASRAGRDYSMHGNLGGSFPGRIPYQVVLGDSVDTIWWEASGQTQYDIFKNDWSNSWGSFRLQLAEAMARGRKPTMFLRRHKKVTADLVEHEWAEVSAGGAVLFDDPPELLRTHPEIGARLEDYLRFREQHRAIYEPRGRRPYAQVGLLYSVPTLMYRSYVPTGLKNPPINDLSGVARALEEGHVPYQVVILDHEALGPDRVTLEMLQRFRVLIAPSLESLSDAHFELLRRYLQGGGKLLIVGKLGIRNERHGRRSKDLVAHLEAAGRVLRPLRVGFPGSRSRATPGTRAQSSKLFVAVRNALDPPILFGDLPRTLWVKTWQHDDGLWSAHFVNYDVDFAKGVARPTRATQLRLQVPPGGKTQEAMWLVPGEPPRKLPLRSRGGHVEVRLPGLNVYGVLLIGPRGLDARASALRRGDRFLLRARFAGAPLAQTEARARSVEKLRAGNARAYERAARELLVSVAEQRERELIERHERMLEAPRDAVLALDFGESKPESPWKSVLADTRYDVRLGYGWLEPHDPSGATPEERHYRRSRRPGSPDLVRKAGLLGPWPHDPALRAPPLKNALVSGRSQRFRIDLPDGLYRIELAQTNAGWPQRNHLVSGMTGADGSALLLDLPLDVGELRPRSFTTRSRDGKIELWLGGPTGFGVASLVVRPAASEQPDVLALGGLREWRVSPRYPNPDWYPIEQTRAPPEEHPGAPDTKAWQVLRAPAQGLPLVDLGSPQNGDVGDVRYALAYIERESAGPAYLSLGASSAAMAWLNGERVAYLPNLKGVMRDEALVRVDLRAGRNTLLLKLSRFWERRWLFYASVRRD